MPNEPERLPWYLTLLCWISIAGPLFAIPTALLQRDAIFARFPKLTTPLLATQIVFALVGVVGSALILGRRRAGVWLVVVSGAGVVVTDLLYESHAHAAVAAGLTAVLGAAAHAQRGPAR